MIRVVLSKIIIDEKRQEQVIVLKEKEGDRQVPIVIGFAEASSIKIRISGMDVPRPMTHDLLAHVLEFLGGHVERVIIDKLVANTFHAKLEIKSRAGVLKKIDARPSDGIALAVRLKTPIFIAENIFKQSSLLQA